MRVSIALKIFVIVVAVLLLMTAVAAISTLQARKVGSLLDRAAGQYMPAYAALARADIRSLEQALALRRLVIAGLAQRTADASDRDHALVASKGADTDTEIATARELIAHEIAAETPFVDDLALARLDTRLEVLQVARRKHEALIAALLAAMASGGLDRISGPLEQVDAMRDELKDQFEETRVEMRQLMLDAAQRTGDEQKRVIIISIALTALAGVLGLALAAAMTIALLRPVRRLLAGTQAVESGALDIDIPVTTSDEIGRLTIAFNHMVSELRSKARIRDTFGKYVDPRIVAGLIERPDLAALEGERRTMTVVFCDLMGFSALGERLTPKNLVTVTNRYLTVMSEPVRQQGGIIDKYIGDAIMAYWGPPFTDAEQQATLACRAALAMVDRVPGFLAELPDLTGIRRGLPPVGMRIGIATGAVLVGNIGSDTMKSYTVLGGPVNLAARLEGANKHYGTAVLVSQATAEMAGDAVELREIDTIVALGGQEPERIFEVMARKDVIDAQGQALRGAYLQGLAAYRQQDWDTARRHFSSALQAAPNDGPSRAMLAQIGEWQINPPPAGWNGAWHLTEK